ncbi:hypothetical protein BDAP_000861 [Binucleata daphniae]
MNSKTNIKKSVTTTVFIIALSSFVPSILLHFSKSTKNDVKDDLVLEKLPYQTKAYYKAYEDKINLSIEPVNLDVHKANIRLFNISPYFFILVVDNRMAFIDTNAFIKTLEYPIKNISCTGFLWFICKLTDISKIIHYNVKIKKNENSLICDGEKMDISNYLLILKNMLRCQLKNKTNDDSSDESMTDKRDKKNETKK